MRYADRPDPSADSRIDPQAVHLDEWAYGLLDTAEKSGIPTNHHTCKVVLSRAQRCTILELEIRDDIREVLTVTATGPRTFNFTPEGLASICHALAGPLLEARGKYRNQLLKAAEKVAQGLTEGLTMKKKRRRHSAKPKTAFQIKISLKDIKPGAWRRVQVLDCTLPELHAVVQAVMGWQNCHLYSFRAGDAIYADPSLCEMMKHSDGRRVKLSHMAKEGHVRLDYVYDFGDHWEHLIEIESAFQPDNGAAFPICLEGAGASPPEDVGGATGYEEFLRAINDPADEEHENCLERCGGWFDPEVFDLELVNRVLAMMR